ncbi:hypothetical protein HJG60_008303 [Phyllostomus discolor]|uniref:Uncharacterized protein n=1 Tax=Phyllostomus discolor TaxID=89673 RepID=A0A833Z8X1_9CHIR|nr:hypothetical protein HJG60_008303 [Phyllostomus discolor]
MGLGSVTENPAFPEPSTIPGRPLQAPPTCGVAFHRDQGSCEGTRAFLHGDLQLTTGCPLPSEKSVWWEEPLAKLLPSLPHRTELPPPCGERQMAEQGPVGSYLGTGGMRSVTRWGLVDLREARKAIVVTHGGAQAEKTHLLGCRLERGVPITSPHRQAT